jgi:hypothetical protein
VAKAQSLDPPFNSNRDYNVTFRDKSGNATDAQLLAFEDTWHAWSTGRGSRPDALCNLQPESPTRNQRYRLARHEARVDLPGPHLIEGP